MATGKHEEKSVPRVSCAIVTVSDTRTEETDKSGVCIRDVLESAGHTLCSYEIIPDEPDQVRDRVLALCVRDDCQAVLLNGGTGVSTRDTTCEAVSTLFEKTLEGFGEIFRMLSFEQIGPRAMLSRATAGVCKGTVVFSMPGSPSAVLLAMEKIIGPGLGHTMAMLRS